MFECPICGAEADKEHGHRFTAFLNYDVGGVDVPLYTLLEYARCLNCGVHFQLNGIPAKNLKAYYVSGQYRDILDYGFEGRDVSAQPYVDFVLEFLKSIDFTPTRHLDFGCAQGVMLRTVSWEAVGIEIDEVAAEYARSFGCEVYSTISQAPRKFDFITAMDVLEHVPDPLIELTRLRKKLTKNGKILLSVPDREDTLRAYSLHHLFGFDRDSALMLMERAGLASSIMIKAGDRGPLMFLGTLNA